MDQFHRRAAVPRLQLQEGPGILLQRQTDAIIGRLAKIPELKVIATTSVMRYKETDKDIKEIGRKLQ